MIERSDGGVLWCLQRFTSLSPTSFFDAYRSSCITKWIHLAASRSHELLIRPTRLWSLTPVGPCAFDDHNSVDLEVGECTDIQSNSWQLRSIQLRSSQDCRSYYLHVVLTERLFWKIFNASFSSLARSAPDQLEFLQRLAQMIFQFVVSFLHILNNVKSSSLTSVWSRSSRPRALIKLQVVIQNACHSDTRFELGGPFWTLNQYHEFTFLIDTSLWYIATNFKSILKIPYSVTFFLCGMISTYP